MRIRGLAVLATAAMILGSGGARDRTILRVALKLAAADVDALTKAGYEVLTVAHDQSWADVVAPPSKRLKHLTILAERPVDGSYRPDRAYKTPATVEAALRDYAQRFPRLVTLRSIGKSGEGRDIWAVKLTADGYADLITKPVVLFNAMHHAREVMSTEVALDTIDYLLARYGKEEDATRWLDETEVWVLPMLNVDGNNRVWTQDAMWRKNTREGHGTDINRNYPFQWKACDGSSGDPGDETYRGTGPASEPETRAMMAFVTEIRPVFDISYHSYGEYVLYPYGCRGQRADAAEVEAIGKELAARLPSDAGPGHYKAGSWPTIPSTWMSSAAPPTSSPAKCPDL